MSKKNPAVLIAVLDWGLGHATRSIPLIRQLLLRGVRVILAGNGPSGKLLKMQFPELRFYELPEYNIRYAHGAMMPWVMLRNLPFIYRAISRENKLADAIFKKESIDVIISDNRYGMHHMTCKNIFISHQLAPILPSLAWPLSTLFYKKYSAWLFRFDRIWIPDTADRIFSGKLSVPRIPLPDIRFIGPQSRFSGFEKKSVPVSIPILAILSGPEPQRSFLEKRLINEAHKHQEKMILIAGKPGSQRHDSDLIRILPHMNDVEFIDHIFRAETVITRSGYSSIMDLYAIGKGAVLIPTPGQTEQEYLAEIHSENGPFYTISQKKMTLANLPTSPSIDKSYSNLFNGELLSAAIDEVLDELQLLR